MSKGVSRRGFLKGGAVLGTGLVFGVTLPGCGGAAASRRAGAWGHRAWVRIAPDNTVTVIVAESEMGQGVMTALPMLVAEELEVPWDAIRFEHAPVHPAYGPQSTGGSTSVREAWGPLRKVAATARQMLITAAAQTWGVPRNACAADRGAVIHHPSGRSLTYGELAETAAAVPVPPEVRLKSPDEFRIIGRPTALLDAPLKLSGEAVFGIDMDTPGMLTAVIARGPAFGSKALSYDAAKARAVPGVRDVIEIDSGVAVLAEDYWAASQGAKALEVRWDGGTEPELDSRAVLTRFRGHAGEPGTVALSRGNMEAALGRAHKTIEAEYKVPFQAHATLEPMNGTVSVTRDRIEVWAPTQSPTGAKAAALHCGFSPIRGFFEKSKGRITGEGVDSVEVHTTFLGGGFGRRLKDDFVVEAVQLSRAARSPVKVVWSREDDMRHDFYRPASYHRLKAALDPEEKPVAWRHRAVGCSNPAQGAGHLDYAISDVLVDAVTVPLPVPTGPWRSIGHSNAAYVNECFLDEIAVSAGRDPYELRRELLETSPRLREVLDLAADKAGWGRSLPEGHHLGIAAHRSFGSHVAEVVELSVGDRGSIRLHRVVCAVDCGIAVNPDTIKAQMEGAVVFALTATLKSAITLRRGGVEQSNFHDFPLLTMREMPVVDTYIVASREHPGGIGEPGVPPLAPAVASAVYAATGRRVRRLPLTAAALRTE